MYFHRFCIFLFLSSVSVQSQFVEINKIYNDIFPSIPNYILNSTNEQCVEDSVLYLENFQNYTAWAFKMMDASSQSLLGQMVSGSINIGHFDECLDIEGAPFQTQYCLINIELKLEESEGINNTVFENILTPWNRFRNRRNFYKNGLCLPKSCDYNTLSNFLVANFEDYSNRNDFNITYEVAFPPNACTETKHEEYDAYDITFCAIIIVFVVLVIVSTLVRCIFDLKSNSPLEIVIRSFSMSHTIYDDLLKVNGNDLKYLHGIKVLLIIVVVFGHCQAFIHNGIVYNFNYSENVHTLLPNYFVLRGDYTVDTFFVISGLLLSYTLLNQLSKRKHINYFMVIFLRYIRLTPVYAIVVFFFATVLSKIGDGPLWHLFVDLEKETCRENWWTNLLYINNYVNTDRACIPTTWYMPCDFHFFIIGLFIIQLLHVKRQMGFALITGLIFISMLITFSITYIHDLHGIIVFSLEFIAQPRVDKTFNERYIKSHAKITPFLVGLFLGYIFFARKDLKDRLSKVKSVVIGILSIIIMVLLMLSGRFFYVTKFPYPIIAAAYAGLNKIFWAIAIGALLICLQYERLESIRQILSAKVLVILSKLTFSVYLLHPIYIIYVTGIQRVAVVEGHFTLITTVMQTLTMTYLLSLFAYIIIEAPLRNILRHTLYPSRENHASSKLTVVMDSKGFSGDKSDDTSTRF